MLTEAVEEDIVDMEALKAFDDPDIESKLFVINMINSSVRHLLDDYLGHEGMCIDREYPGLAQSRVYEFDQVCEVLQRKTIGEILDLLDGY